MTLAPGTYSIGPDTGPLKLYTTRAGVAARVGHDLTITFRTWSGSVVVADQDPTSARLDVDLETDSLEILDATGGVAPLSADDRKDITATALRLLDADREPHATYRSTGVSSSTDGATIDGTLTLRGQSAAVTLAVIETGPATWHAKATLLQSALGIKPYKAFFGALRLADEVRIEVDVELAGTSPTS